MDYRRAPASDATHAGAWIARLRRGALAERKRERTRLCVWESEGGALFAARSGEHAIDLFPRYER